ncbi:kinetochore protein Mis18 [Sugiyamaella lignohabitans]|uniref:Protein yippee-like n=1 Tax=Sugiyamaella lignohabitans TaxID=796027 RepID=A0A167F5Q5_9ASCO|nr:kinetochore protein Mis18 [Sugiyamaella lignohabitans]ANB14863.1 kinetochore protein Mis18 [Sugiyamaella lignohabitans]
MNYATESLSVLEAISVVPSRQETEDSGSTYCELLCTGCSTSIGRVYKSTPHTLDHLRDKYTFFTSKSKCYEVGKLDIIPQAVDAEIIQATRPSPDDVAKRFAVLEAVVLALHKRIDSLTADSTDTV